MKLYLAGPMSGYPEHNFPAFHAEAARLRALGHVVVNPAELNCDVAAFKADPLAAWVACMCVDIAQLVTCNAIALLPGWEKSEGAKLEEHIAAQLRFFRCPAAEFPAASAT